MSDALPPWARPRKVVVVATLPKLANGKPDSSRGAWRRARRERFGEPVRDEPLLAATRAIIERVIGPDRTPPTGGPETPLADGFWLDSIELVEVLVACEIEFGILLDETSDFEAGAFGTLGTLTAPSNPSSRLRRAHP